MQEQYLVKFGGGGESNANPLSIAITILAGILILVLPRKKALMVFMVTAFIIPYGQVIVVVGLHFQMVRLLIIFGWMRIVKDFGKYKPLFGDTHPIEKAFVGLTIAGAIGFSLCYREWPAVLNQLGSIYTSFGIYFLLRFLVREQEDIDQLVKALITIAVIAALPMVLEQVSSRNIFGIIGGVPLETQVRDGRIRSQAFFAHSIIAGCFGATLVPLCFYLWTQAKQRSWAVVGTIAALVMTITSASSTPLLALLGGMMAICFWPIRENMRWVRRSVVASLIFLHLIMKGPVWALIDHIDIVGGNSANHRYQLVDQFIRHFWDWWLVGTAHNGDWGYDMWDTANFYVGVGESGGLLAFIFLLAIISRGFRAIGLARSSFPSDKSQQWSYWMLGAALFSQCVAFFGISYFDQTVADWYALLVIIIVATQRFIPVKAKIFESAVATRDLVELPGTANGIPIGSGPGISHSRKTFASVRGNAGANDDQ